MAKKGRLHPILGAFLLDEQVYDPIVEHKTPLRRGFMLLMIILLFVGLTRSIGMALELLATPRLDLFEGALYNALISMGWYAAQVEASADFATTFAQIYGLGWQVGRLIGGVPSGFGILTIFIAQLLFGILNWFFYGSLTHGIARWFGSSTSYKQFMGAFGLAYAPLIFFTATLVPSLTVATGLVYLWMLATRFQAIKQSHQLSWVHSLAIIFVPQLLLCLLVPTVIMIVLAIYLT